MTTTEQPREAHWMGGAYQVSLDVRGPIAQQVSAIVNRQPPSLGQLWRSHGDWIEERRRAAALSGADYVNWYWLRWVWAAVQAGLVSIVRLLEWAVLSSNPVRTIISIIAMTATFIYLIWS
jgi:hypothetical protein